MRELYIAPEAETIYFVAEDALANQVSFAGIDVTDQQDGYWEGWEKWFG